MWYRTSASEQWGLVAGGVRIGWIGDPDEQVQVDGDTRHGGGRDTERRGGYDEHPELGRRRCRRAERGGQRERELWEIHGGNHGSSGGGTCNTVEHAGCGGDVDVNSGNSVASATGDTAVAGATTLDVAGDVDVNSGRFTVASTTGNTVVAGTLNAGATR